MLPCQEKVYMGTDRGWERSVRWHLGHENRCFKYWGLKKELMNQGLWRWASVKGLPVCTACRHQSVAFATHSLYLSLELGQILKVHRLLDGATATTLPCISHPLPWGWLHGCLLLSALRAVITVISFNQLYTLFAFQFFFFYVSPNVLGQTCWNLLRFSK